MESQHGFPTVPWSTPLNSAYLVPSSCITNIWLSEGLCAGLLDARLTSRHSECWISSMIAIKSSSFTSFCPGNFYVDAGLPFAFSALSESGGVRLLAAHWMPVQSDTQNGPQVNVLYPTNLSVSLHGLFGGQIGQSTECALFL